MAGSRVETSSLKVAVKVPPCLGSAKAVPAVASSRGAAATPISRDLCMLVLPFLSFSMQLDARVDQWRDEVGQEVPEHDEDGGDDGHAHDDGDVDALDRLPGELTDAGPAEDAFDHDDAGHEGADV